jgi:hypothetical protein
MRTQGRAAGGLAVAAARLIFSKIISQQQPQYSCQYLFYHMPTFSISLFDILYDSYVHAKLLKTVDVKISNETRR